MIDAQTTFPPLFRMAVKSGSLPTVLLHIRRGLDVNSVGERGRTPLMVAAAAGRLEVCQLLLEEGAAAGATDADGNDAMAIARTSDQHAVVEFLSRYRESKATKDTVEDHGLGPLQPAEPPDVTPIARDIELSPAGAPGLEELLSDGGWDAEPPPGPPPQHDQDRFDGALAVQSAISARVAANTDADWSDIALALPRTAARAVRAPELAAAPAVRSLLLQATVCGVVTRDQLTAAGLAGGLVSDAGSSSCLEAILEDLGCEVVDSAADPWPADRTRAGEASRFSRNQADEAEELLGVLAASDLDLSRTYEAHVARRKPLSKADQSGLWKAYRQGRRDLAFALSTAPHVLDELVARLDRLSIRQETRRAEAAEVLQVEDGASGEAALEGEDADSHTAEHSMDALDPALAHDLGHAVLRARAADNPDVDLADQLLELELPVHLIDQVRRALLLDPASATACEQLSAALRKIELARTRLIEAHQRFVLWIARRYRDRGLDLMDLVQEGNIGLMKAIEKYDPARGFAFTTYATWWVRQSITRTIADHGATIRIPVHRQEVISKVTRAARRFLNEHGQEATAEELAEALDLPVAMMAVVMNLRFEMCSLDEGLTPGAPPLWEALPDTKAKLPDQAVFAAELRRLSAAALQTLSPREERILRMRLGIDLPTDYTLEEIGDPIGVTRERVRQIEAKALGKLKHPSRSRKLRSLLDG